MPRITVTASESSRDVVRETRERRRLKTLLVDGTRFSFQNRLVLEEFVRKRKKILETNTRKTRDEMNAAFEIGDDQLGLDKMRDIGAMYTEIHELELMEVLTDIYKEVDLDKTIAEPDPESLEQADKPLLKTLEMPANISMNPEVTIDLAGFVLLCGFVVTVLMLRY